MFPLRHLVVVVACAVALAAFGGAGDVSRAAAAAPVATAKPQITGKRRVTQTLQLSTGRWRGAPVKYDYRWGRAQSSRDRAKWTPLPGKTGARWKRFTVPVSSAGTYLIGCVRAKAKSGPWSAWSCASPTRMVPPGMTIKPSAAGEVIAGRYITGRAGVWKAATKGHSYIWQTSPNGSTWTNATGPHRSQFRYLVPAKEAGLRFRIRAIGRNPGGNSLPVYSNDVLPPVPRPVESPQRLIREGDGALSASAGDWTGGPALSIAYRWQSAPAREGAWGVARGTGVESASYAPDTSEGGRWIRVVVTASNGGGSEQLISDPIQLPAPPRNVEAPQITGVAQQGRTLAGSDGTWTGDVTGYAREWLRCDAAGAACAGTGQVGTTYDAAPADVGSALVLQVRATGPAGSTVARSAATAVVLPPAPVSDAAPVVTGTAQMGATLSATQGTWSNPVTTYAYQWQRSMDGSTWVDITGATAATYVPVRADADAVLRVVVRATGAGGAATASSAPTAGVLPPAPVATVAPSVSGTAREGQTLTASDGTWTDATSLARVWLRCNASGAACASTGQTAATYALGAADVDGTLRLAVTANGTGGISTVQSVATSVVLPLPPANTAVPTLSGTAGVGETMSVSTGSWDSSGAITGYVYRWESSTDGTSDWAVIDGATASTYPVRPADGNRYLRAVVVAQNAGGDSSPATTAASVQVSAVPANTVAPTVSGTPAVGEALAMTDGTWTGTPAPTFTYAWERSETGTDGWSRITGATASDYTLTTADAGRYLRAVVIATNAPGSTEATSAPTAMAPAYASAPPVACAAPQVGALCTPQDTGTWHGTTSPEVITWEAYVDGTWVPVGTGPTFMPGTDEYDAPLRLTVTRTNGAGTPTSATSAASDPVLPAAPAVATPAICAAPQVGQACTGEDIAVSGQGTITYTWRWQYAATPAGPFNDIPGATGSVTSPAFMPTSAQYDGRLQLVVVASNAGGTTTVTSPVSAVVLPAPPVVATPTVCADPQVGASCAGGNIAATGQGTITYERQWLYSATAGGSYLPIDGATGDAFTPTEDQFEGYLVLQVTARNDGGSAVATSEPTTAAVLPAAPVAASLGTTCAAPQVGEVCVGQAAAFDGQGAITVSVQWESNDGAGWDPIPGATDPSYTPTGAEYDEPLRLVSTAENTGGTAAVESSASDATLPAPPRLAPGGNSVTCASPQVGEPCTADAGTWESQGPISYAYRWERADAAAGPYGAISGATGQTYTPMEDDFGKYLRVVVVASNAGGSSPEESSVGSDPVLPAAPSLASASEACATPQVEEACVGSAATYTGQGAIARTYQWQRDDPTDGWTNIAGASGTITGDVGDAAVVSYTPVAGDFDVALRLITRASNSGGETESISAATPATLPAQPMPGPGAADITCGTPRVGEPCAGSAGDWGTQGVTTYTYTWQVSDGMSWTTVQTTTTTDTTDSYTPDSDEAGQPLRLTVQASNAGGTASTAGSPVSVAPYNFGGLDLPTVCPTPEAGSVCAGTAGTWAGAPTSYIYQWQRLEVGGWANIAGATGLNYTPVAGDANLSLRLRVTAIANGSASAPAESASSEPTIGYPVVTGGDLTSDATYYYRTFTADGSLAIQNRALAIDYLIVAGGGAGGTVSLPGGFGGASGGGGGGGVVQGSTTSGVGSLAVSVGAGGEPSATGGVGGSGGNSTLGAMVAYGGGGGAGRTSAGASVAGANGGSGGGGLTSAGGAVSAAGSGVSGQGFAGGAPGATNTATSGGGGGASATAAGVTFGSWTVSCQGGAGVQATINAQYYGGGGGGAWANYPQVSCPGGVGGGASGTDASTRAGSANTGGGGGAAAAPSNAGTYVGGAGGSGVVIVRYLRAAVGG